MKKKQIFTGSIVLDPGVIGNVKVHSDLKAPGKKDCYILAEKDVEDGKIILCDWKHRKEYVTWFVGEYDYTGNYDYTGTVDGRYFSYDHLSSMDQEKAYKEAFLNFIHRK